MILVADPGTSSLAWLKDHPQQKAAQGQPGSGNKKTGADAPDLELLVPLGTVVADDQGTLLADLAGSGDRFVAAKGGRGGRGNAAFLSGNRRVPGFAELGEPPEERWLRLELRMLADVAVIGFPNAGKSTLVAAVSRARPKIADYPFTTLEPHPGVVEVGDERFTICDIPGLVEGASQGKGLGLKFLRHVERAPVLVHVIDLATARDPLDDYQKLRAELAAFRKELLNRPEVVVLNKQDVVEGRVIEHALERLSNDGVDPFVISAETRVGLDDLVLRLWTLVQLDRETRSDLSFELFRTEPDQIQVRREGEAWRVSGRQVERWVAMTDLSNSEAVNYLQSRFEKAGVERQLTEAGAREGDEVRIGGAVLEWWP